MKKAAKDQKWPRQLTIIRHAVSGYNAQRLEKEKDPGYRRFRAFFEVDPTAKKTQELARSLVVKWSLKFGDHDTPLANSVNLEAIATGEELADERKDVTDVIYVSPYVRTNATLEGLKKGWRSLSEVPVVQDERIREQEHGLYLLDNDWRLFYALHPEQYDLRMREGRYFYRYPQGESVPDVQLRLKDFLDTLIREHAGQDVLVVTHHLAILALRMNLERFDWNEFLRLDKEEKPINCGVSTYTSEPGDGRNRQGKLRLKHYNVCYY